MCNSGFRTWPIETKHTFTTCTKKQTIKQAIMEKDHKRKERLNNNSTYYRNVDMMIGFVLYIRFVVSKTF